ncbi:hypothetical protein WBP06_16035 [Novosphingobium sp. BL-8H]|uniref:hypothetical protein n=1 Tax=Novosphingobium sp. BL-8H TaxID=3127640 RepID=UPI00375703A5
MSRTSVAMNRGNGFVFAVNRFLEIDSIRRRKALNHCESLAESGLNVIPQACAAVALLASNTGFGIVSPHR